MDRTALKNVCILLLLISGIFGILDNIAYIKMKAVIQKEERFIDEMCHKNDSLLDIQLQLQQKCWNLEDSILKLQRYENNP